MIGSGDRMPANCRPAGSFLQEEMNARSWTSLDVAMRMGGVTQREMAIDQFCVEMTLAVDDPNLILDAITSAKLGRVFDVSADYFANLDAAWRRWTKACPGAAETEGGGG